MITIDVVHCENKQSLLNFFNDTLDFWVVIFLICMYECPIISWYLAISDYLVTQLLVCTMRSSNPLYRLIHWTGHRFEPRYPHKSACLSDSFYTYVCVSLTFWLPLCESKALGRVGTAVSRRTCQSRCYPQIGSNPGPRYDAIHTKESEALPLNHCNQLKVWPECLPYNLSVHYCKISCNQQSPCNTAFGLNNEKLEPTITPHPLDGSQVQASLYP